MIIQAEMYAFMKDLPTFIELYSLLEMMKSESYLSSLLGSYGVCLVMIMSLLVNPGLGREAFCLGN
jgi:hypothetical protein